jgi:hypothetical protein
MSILSSVESFAGKFEAEFVKIFKKAPSFEQSAQAVIAVAGPATEAILAVTDPAVLPIVTPIINVVQAKLATLSTITKTVQVPAPGSSTAQEVSTVLGDIQGETASILDLAGVKNSAKVEQITAEVNGIVAALKSLSSLLVAPAAA